jgi:DNA-directed RNA polymerase-3 subunit RPC5
MLWSCSRLCHTSNAFVTITTSLTGFPAASQLAATIRFHSFLTVHLTMPARVKSSVLDPIEMNDHNVYPEEDEIVREIDVFLSPELASQLYVLQYPLEHGTAYVLPTEARFKLQHNILELSEPFPQSAELQGEFCHLERRVFESQTIPVTTHLCVGKLKETENGTAMHLVPLNHVAQMRPSFRHLKEQHLDEPLYDSEDEALPSDDKAKQNKPVAFQRKETERAANARRSSYAFMKASEESEPWVDLEVCAEGSIEYQSVMDKVICSAPDKNVIHNNGISEADYVESLNYLPKDADEPMKNPVIEEIKLTSIVAQLTALMLGGCPIPFSILRNHVSAQISNANMLMALFACSILVRGNFCIQSKHLSIPKPMQRARTFVLMLFRQETIERTRLDHAFAGKVSSERILSLLKQTGRLTASGWTLKVEEDFTFQARFPDQVRAYQKMVDKLEYKFQHELKRYRSDVLES